MLNANQLEAVRWGEGPLLVLAGPGSGKTKVLTHRIARLIKESPDESFQILGLTFTNRAATEMRERVNALVPDAYKRTNITTYHAFSTAILRQHGHHLGISPDFAILSQDADRRAVLDDAIKSAGLARTERRDSRHLLPIVTRLTEQNVQADAAVAAALLLGECPNGGSVDAQQIGEIYAHYRRQMIENNELDFGGLVAESMRLLTETAAGKMVRRIYPYVCVDEFQDTNDAQYQILCSVVDPDTRNLFVVADGDQTIYEWNGAREERVRQIREHFGMTVMELPENYRCPSSVVRIANRLIANNPGHNKTGSVPGKLGEQDQSVRVVEFDTAGEEADWVAGDIAARPAGARRGCAVLARTHGALKNVVDALKSHGIRAHMHSRKDRFVNDRMVWLHAVVRLANSRHDNKRLRQVCKSFHSLEGVDLIADSITSEAMVAGDEDYLRAWWQAALREEMSPTTRSFLSNEMPKLIDRLDVISFVQGCFAWFEKRQSEHPEPDYNAEYTGERDAWKALSKEAAEETGHGQMTLSMLLQYIDLHSKEPPAPQGSVPCYTIFASKGMEFDHIYMIRLSEEVLPDWRAVRSGSDSREMQEERRICFVGITRAEKSLTMTYPLNASGFDKEPSRFLVEMGLVGGSA